MPEYVVLMVAQIINGEEIPVDKQDQLIMDVNTDQVPIQELKNLSIQDLVIKQDLLKQHIDDLKSISSELNKQYDTIRLVVLPEKMDEEDTSNITVAGADRKLSACIQSDIYFSIPAATKEETYEWLKENGHEDLVQETVNSSSGKAWAKEMVKKGLPLPQELFKITPFSRVQITRKK